MQSYVLLLIHIKICFNMLSTRRLQFDFNYVLLLCFISYCLFQCFTDGAIVPIVFMINTYSVCCFYSVKDLVLKRCYINKVFYYIVIIFVVKQQQEVNP